MSEGPLDQLVKSLARLPGLGPRSARRIALHLLTNRKDSLAPLIQALEKTEATIRNCKNCGNLDSCNPCRICSDSRRGDSQLCVVRGVSDLWAVERTGTYKGQYHILGGVLSALDGIGPDELRIEGLILRIKEKPPEEIILALSATVDGQATAHYLSDKIQDVVDINITRIAHGVPIGGELDYLDDGTLTAAFKARHKL